jgi:outer membrane biosynthesis protein TonB
MGEVPVPTRDIILTGMGRPGATLEVAMPLRTVSWHEYRNDKEHLEKEKKKERKQKKQKEKEKENEKEKEKEEKQKKDRKQKHKGGWLRGMMGRSTSSSTIATQGRAEQEREEGRAGTVRLSIAITFSSDNESATQWP